MVLVREILDIVDVDFPRPRQDDLRNSMEFTQMRARVSQTLKDSAVT